MGSEWPDQRDKTGIGSVARGVFFILRLLLKSKQKMLPSYLDSPS